MAIVVQKYGGTTVVVPAMDDTTDNLLALASKVGACATI
jgi:aspartokinase